MKFIVDGDGYISRSAAKALLTDIAYPHEKPVFITPLVPSESMRIVDAALDLMANAGLCEHRLTLDLMEQLKDFSNVVLIVLGAATREETVKIAFNWDIPVLDLEKGLYPVVVDPVKGIL